MIEGRKCKSCGHVYVPSTVDNCSRCGNSQLEKVNFSGEGRIYSQTTVHVPTVAFKDEAPFVIGLVDLLEGPRITVRLNLSGDQLKIGRQVFCIDQNPKYLVFG